MPVSTVQAFATPSSYLGLGKETTRNTIQAPTLWVPYKAPTLKDDFTFLEDKGLRGSMVDVYNLVQGVVASSHDFSGDYFADTSPPLIGALLGGTDVVTGTTSPFSHVFALLNNSPATGNQPPSFTLTDNYVYNTRQYAGGVFSDFGLKWNANGMVEWQAKAMGFLSVTHAAINSGFSNLTPAPAWDITTTFAGTASVHVESGEINFKRTVTPLYTSNGTKNPYLIFAGPMSIDGKLTCIIADDTELSAYLAGVPITLDVKIVDPATTFSTDIHMNQVTLIQGPLNRSKDYITIDLTYRSMPNATDGTSGNSPAKITVLNGTAGAYQ